MANGSEVELRGRVRYVNLMCMDVTQGVTDRRRQTVPPVTRVSVKQLDPLYSRDGTEIS